MNKKIILTSTILLASLALAGCGNNQSTNSSTKAENSSLKAENSSLKAKKSSEKQAKYSEQDYALMAYLKLQGQTANELNRNKNNMNWNQDGNTYRIDFGAHTTSMTVTEDNVEVTYDDVQGDHMGQGNGHKTYSKQQLAKEFGNQKSVIEEILSSASQGQSSNGQTNNNQNNGNAQGQSADQNTTNDSAASSSNADNNGGEKPLVKDGNTYRPKYDENGQIASWQVTGSDGITRTMGDPSPNWQEIENEYNAENGK